MMEHPDDAATRTRVIDSYNRHRRTEMGILGVAALVIGGIAGSYGQERVDAQKYQEMQRQHQAEIAKLNAARVPADRILPPHLQFRQNFGEDGVYSVDNHSYGVTFHKDFIGVFNGDCTAKVTQHEISTVVAKDARIKRSAAPTSYDPKLSFTDDVSVPCKFH